MKKSKFTEEQIAYVLRQVESGTPPADACRQMGVSEATSHIWKRSMRTWVSASCGSCARSRTGPSVVAYSSISFGQGNL